MPEEPTKVPVEAPPPEPPEAAPSPLPPEAPPSESWETRFKYLFADFENFRKRVDRERDSIRDRARADLIRGLLPLYEAAVRAREAVGRLPGSDPVRRGVELVAREWDAFFEGARVTPVARSGAPFEADVHEAVAETPVTANHPEGAVVEIVQQGYRMGPVLLRPAKVVVARRPSPAEGHGPEGPGEASTG